MKIKNIFLFFIIISAACLSMSFIISNNTEQRKNSEKAVIQLNLKEFNKRVYDTSEANQDKEIKFLGDRPAIIDFYADWCGPCRKLSPILEELAKEYKGKIDFYKVNVENEKQLAGMFGVQSLPTLLFIPEKDNPQKVLGFRSKEDLVKIIDQLLLK